MDGHAIHGELCFARPYDWIVAGKKAGDPDVVHPTRGVRQLVKRVVHGSNFMMAAMTLYLTMGRDAVVVAAKLAGHSNADSWPQEELVNFRSEEHTSELQSLMRISYAVFCLKKKNKHKQKKKKRTRRMKTCNN